MKAKRQIHEFQPFNVTIRVESERELQFLWCLFNHGKAPLADFANEYVPKLKIPPFEPREVDTLPIFHQLELARKEYSDDEWDDLDIIPMN